MEIAPEYLETNVDLDALKHTFGEKLVEGMTNRLHGGERASQEDIDEMDHRINSIIAERMSAVHAKNHYVWFTHRRDNRFTYVDWPVAGYVGRNRFDVWDLPQVEKALTRLKRNRTITNISVIGKLPEHWYNGAL